MLSRIFYSIFMAMPFLVYLGASAQVCSESELRLCEEKQKLLTNNKDFLEQTVEEQNRSCSVVLDAVQCVNSYTERCFQKAQADLYHSITSGSIKLLEDLCTHDSDFRKQYLQHADCYRHVSAELRMCRLNYVLQIASVEARNLQMEDKLKIFCCLYDGYKACTRRVVLRKCSKEAADFAENMIIRDIGPMVRLQCIDSKHDSTDCLSSLSINTGSSTVPSVSLFFSGFISLILTMASHIYLTHR